MPPPDPAAHRNRHFERIHDRVVSVAVGLLAAAFAAAALLVALGFESLYPLTATVGLVAYAALFFTDELALVLAARTIAR